MAPAVARAPDPTLIPWTWLQPSLQMRTDQPINSAQITRAGGLTYTKDAYTSQSTFGVYAASATVDSIVPDDPANFANFLTVYFASPLTYVPVFTLSLVPRTDAERIIILGLEIGTRVTLGQGTVVDGTGNTTVLTVPGTVPAGAVSSVIEGIRHYSSATDRVVQWTMAPLLGVTPGTEGPWFRLDVSALDGSDAVPF